jgi:hypothetical protein
VILDRISFFFSPGCENLPKKETLIAMPKCYHDGLILLLSNKFFETGQRP